MSLENRKLREVIESLRQELSVKSKRLLELQFEQEELQKSRKRNQTEIEEYQARLAKERENQREMQLRLEQLISEVQFLKNLSR